jgi:hypothetical protein
MPSKLQRQNKIITLFAIALRYGFNSKDVKKTMVMIVVCIANKLALEGAIIVVATMPNFTPALKTSQ